MDLIPSPQSFPVETSGGALVEIQRPDRGPGTHQSGGPNWQPAPGAGDQAGAGTVTGRPPVREWRVGEAGHAPGRRALQGDSPRPGSALPSFEELTGPGQPPATSLRSVWDQLGPEKGVGWVSRRGPAGPEEWNAVTGGTPPTAFSAGACRPSESTRGTQTPTQYP